MEEEGLISDRISEDYSLMHLTNAPIITCASNAKDALKIVRDHPMDIVISGLRVGSDMTAIDMAREIKVIDPDLPISILTPESGQASQMQDSILQSPYINKLFFWNGDAKLFTAIIKFFEDTMNAPYDCLQQQVRVIILVEDSPHFYSTYLPIIYTEILNQTRDLVAEGASDEEKYTLMASRPKILMANSYEQAMDLYHLYQENVLGIISDIQFPKDGEHNSNAGFLFAEHIRKEQSDIPILLQSNNANEASRAAHIQAAFANKNSSHLFQELKSFISNNFGFGDFIFYTPDGKEVGRANTRRQLEYMIDIVPDESIIYHASRNQFSNWLFARGEFELAAFLRTQSCDTFANVDDIRHMIKENLIAARQTRRKLWIKRFSEKEISSISPFIRFGEGSIGGKGRGISFMNKLFAEPSIANDIRAYNITIPKTAAIGTDIFDHFLDRNNLHHIAIESMDNVKIARAFIDAEIETKVVAQLAAFLKKTTQPLAIRSSSISEDSLSQPFAGLYSTYLIPNNHPQFKERLNQFLQAIKLVYASTFFQHPKAYMKASGIEIESEKMAVIIQQVVGKQHDHYFYPDIAGVAQSYNFFPVGYLKPEDGVAQVVMGLGSMAVQGERALRFSPRYPTILPQYSKSSDILINSQQYFHALDLSAHNHLLPIDDTEALVTLSLNNAERHGTLQKLGAVYCPEDDVIYNGLFRNGKRVLTFQRLLNESEYSLPKVLHYILSLGTKSMGCPVEIEYALNLASENKPAEFNFLQIRPLVTGEEAQEVDIRQIMTNDCIIKSNHAMGNGIIKDISHIVFVKSSTFDVNKTSQIAAEINTINTMMINNKKQYVLIGFGRWGTSNPLLGIPIAYPQISNAKVLCEITTRELSVEPSQGTHFFHNIASSRIGYFYINDDDPNSLIDCSWLESQPIYHESEFITCIQTSTPFQIRIDGRNSKGAILKP